MAGPETPLEQELKCSISAASHRELTRHLRELLGDPQRLDQRNHFYDTSRGDLRRAQRSLRLRLENQRLVLTCKQRRAHAGEHHVQEEWERELNAACWPAITARPQAILECLPLPPVVRSLIGERPLRELGRFRNLRLQWTIDGGHLALDHTHFDAQVTDYELEIEADPYHYQAWVDRLARWRIAWHAQPRPKIARLLALADAGERIGAQA